MLQSIQPTLNEIRTRHKSLRTFVDKAKAQLPTLREKLHPSKSAKVDFTKIDPVITVLTEHISKNVDEISDLQHIIEGFQQSIASQGDSQAVKQTTYSAATALKEIFGDGEVIEEELASLQDMIAAIRQIVDLGLKKQAERKTDPKPVINYEAPANVAKPNNVVQASKPTLKDDIIKEDEHPKQTKEVPAKSPGDAQKQRPREFKLIENHRRESGEQKPARVQFKDDSDQIIKAKKTAKQMVQFLENDAFHEADKQIRDTAVKLQQNFTDLSAKQSYYTQYYYEIVSHHENKVEKQSAEQQHYKQVKAHSSQYIESNTTNQFHDNPDQHQQIRAQIQEEDIFKTFEPPTQPQQVFVSAKSVSPQNQPVTLKSLEEKAKLASVAPQEAVLRVKQVSVTSKPETNKWPEKFVPHSDKAVDEQEAYERKKDSYEEEIKMLESSLAVSQNRKVEQSTQLSTYYNLQQKIIELERALRETRSDLQAEMKRNEDYQQQIGEIEAETTQIQATFKSQVNESQKKQNLLEMENAELRLELTKIERIVQKQLKDFEELGRENELLVQENEGLGYYLTMKDADISSLRKQIQTLTRQEFMRAEEKEDIPYAKTVQIEQPKLQTIRNAAQSRTVAAKKRSDELEDSEDANVMHKSVSVIAQKPEAVEQKDVKLLINMLGKVLGQVIY